MSRLNAATLCQITGLTDKRHRQLAKEGFFPEPTKGQYETLPTLQGLFRYYREALARKPTGFYKEREGKLRAERKLAALELEQKLKTLVEVDLVAAAWEAIVSTAAEKLTNLGSKIQSQYSAGLSGPEVKALVNREIDAIRADLAKPPELPEPDRPASPDRADSQ